MHTGQSDISMSRARLLASASLLVPLMLCAPHTVQAQTAETAGQVETVVVTAEKRSEDIQAVAMSISAYSGDMLENKSITSIYDLSKIVPNFTITQINSNRNTTIAIRGIGTSGTNPGIEPSVSIFLDGVYVPNAGTIQANLLDVSTVEVLRGPQGTLYGRNTPVGALNITTREPTFNFEAMADVSAGNYNSRRVAGYVGGGITDELAGRLSGWISSRSGYETIISSGGDIDDSDQYGARGRLLWKPDEATKVNFIGAYSHIVAHCCQPEQINPLGPGGVVTPGYLAAAAAIGFPYDNFDGHDHKVDAANYPDDITDVVNLSATVDRTIFGDHTLTSITAFNYFRDFIAELPGGGVPQPSLDNRQNLSDKLVTEELRVASPTGHFLEYMGGFYFVHEDIKFTNELKALVGFNRVFPNGQSARPGDSSASFYKQQTTGFAFFGQAKANITDNFRLTGGLRYSNDHKDAGLGETDAAGNSTQYNALFGPFSILGLTRSDTKLTWQAGAQYNITPDVMPYFTVGTGFKDGGFNARATSSIAIGFDPENSETYELGVKSSFWNHRLVVNVDVYRMLLHAFQDSELNPITGIGFIVGNAGNRRTQGVEFEAHALPIDELSLDASFSYNDATYSQYLTGQCPGLSAPWNMPVVNTTPAGTCNFTGLTPFGNPKWLWSIGGQWEQPVSNTNFDWFVGGDVDYTGSQFLESTLDVRGFQGSYTLVNARLGLESEAGTWRVWLYGRNLTDESYYTTAAGQGGGALISGGGTAGIGGFMGFYAPPRTYGIEASYHF